MCTSQASAAPPLSSNGHVSSGPLAASRCNEAGPACTALPRPSKPPPAVAGDTLSPTSALAASHASPRLQPRMSPSAPNITAPGAAATGAGDADSSAALARLQAPPLDKAALHMLSHPRWPMPTAAPMFVPAAVLALAPPSGGRTSPLILQTALPGSGPGGRGGSHSGCSKKEDASGGTGGSSTALAGCSSVRVPVP